MGTGAAPVSTQTASTSSTTTVKKQSAPASQPKVTQAQPSTKKPLGPIARPTPPPSNGALTTNGMGDHAPVMNGNKNFCNGNNNNENQVIFRITSGDIVLTSDAAQAPSEDPG